MQDDPETTAVAVRENSGLPLVNAALVTQTMETLKVIRQFVAKELVADTDYGVIPGTGGKPTLLLPGAQKVCMLYNCYPEHAVQATELPGGHVEYRVTTTLIHRGTGQRIGAGVGSCSTMETKYRYRNAKRKCPQCGQEAVIQGKKEYGGGWLCWKKPEKGMNGCGAKFRDGDQSIESQVAGKVENEDIADTRNTVLKMAKKRAHVDAALGLGCLTELFTQDIGDDEHGHDERPATQQPPQRQQSPPAQQQQAEITLDTLVRACGRPTPPDGQSLVERCRWMSGHLKRLVRDFEPQDLEEAISNRLGEGWHPESMTPAQLQIAWMTVGEYVRGIGRQPAAA